MPSCKSHDIFLQDGKQRQNHMSYPYHPWDWYVSLHLVDFYGKCRETYQSHGSFGLYTVEGQDFVPRNSTSHIFLGGKSDEVSVCVLWASPSFTNDKLDVTSFKKNMYSIHLISYHSTSYLHISQHFQTLGPAFPRDFVWTTAQGPDSSKRSVSRRKSSASGVPGLYQQLFLVPLKRW